MSRKPIKRHKSIQPMSRDHHHGLLLGWKIRTGIRNGISPDRIFTYLAWFFNTYHKVHFEEEEKHLFPILGNDHDEVIQALNDHKKIRAFFNKRHVTVQDLQEFESLLTDHIRFEERVLFNTIQKHANEEQLIYLAKHLEDHSFTENREDEFWLSSDES